MRSQALRFLVAGGLVTGLCAAVYLGFAVVLNASPATATLIAHLVGVLVGFRLHAQWTFGGNGACVIDATANARFILVSFTPLTLNAAWVWLLTNVHQGQTWLPVVPMVLLTPIATFLLNRCWVFARAGEGAVSIGDECKSRVNGAK